MKRNKKKNKKTNKTNTNKLKHKVNGQHKKNQNAK